jgi:hypothetical protein
VLGSVLVFVCFAQGGCLEARYMAGKVTSCSAYVGLTVSGDPLSCSGLAIGCYRRSPPPHLCWRSSRCYCCADWAVQWCAWKVW